MPNNHCAVQEAFDLTAEEWLHIAKGSSGGSWIDKSRKKKLWDAVLRFQETHGLAAEVKRGCCLLQ